MQQSQSTQSKEEFRRFCKLKRQELYKKNILNDISEIAIYKIKKCEEYKKARHVMTYFSLPFEINLNKLLEEDKSFYLPRCTKDNLEVCPYKIGDKLIKSSFGVMEPISKAVSPNILDLVITPCISADKNGYRIGFGKGFYDKFFKNNNVLAKKIVVVPGELCFDEVPKDKNDIKCDIVICL